MTQVSFVTTIKAKKGSEDALKAVVVTAMRASRTELGLVSITAYEHADEFGRISVFEVYKDNEAVEAHQATEHYKALFTALPELLEGGVDSVQLTKGTPLE